MWEDFLNHKCDIYHLQTETDEVGYGIKPVERAGSYPEEADITDVACHFGVKSESVAIIQHDPYPVLTGQIKLALPAGTDIRINDKVVSKESGIAYLVKDVPRDIHGHHISVLISRADEVENAI